MHARTHLTSPKMTIAVLLAAATLCPVSATEEGVPQPIASVVARPSRCMTCGVVESIRRFDAGTGEPAYYEFTVRLRDGTVRMSKAESAFSWRAGDHIMLVGGEAAAARTQTQTP